MHMHHLPCFLGTNKMGAPYGDTKGWINPWSNKSQTCFSNLLCSVWPKLCGFALGTTPSTSSILLSVALYDGAPLGSVLGKTELHFFKIFLNLCLWSTSNSFGIVFLWSSMLQNPSSRLDLVPPLVSSTGKSSSHVSNHQENPPCHLLAWRSCKKQVVADPI